MATVTTAQELQQAVKDADPDIEVSGDITGVGMITLAPGVRLHGGSIRFGAKGVRLTKDNIVEDISIVTEPDEVAVLNDTTRDGLGTIELRRVTSRGQVYLVAQDAVRHVVVDGLTITEADVRGRAERPRGYGVEALQGAFTLWNRQADPAVEVTAEIAGVAAGSQQTPVRGSGVFVGGHGDTEGKGDGGVLKVRTLTTGEIHSNGGIPEGTPDLISGGVFVISGAEVETVDNQGPVTTYGQNDMVLDNWGTVQTWTASAPVVSRGPSGIGFVNFGDITRLDVTAPVETFGKGARGFDLYDGSLEHASFASIATHGHGSVGVQISKPLPRLEIRGDLTTDGGEGSSLVKGVQMTLKAIALSVKDGGEVDTVAVGGVIATQGDEVVTVEIEGGLKTLTAGGGIRATGRKSDAVHTTSSGPDLGGLDISATDGRDVVVAGGAG
ncbi:hypothetical protein [Luteipulveratus halotolerans]|uniref:Uncharacterized protein n=1 Tax=Luteipulveratus halotolerans TaxID=1631356 RepID=A0A0L6CJN6_9MICO|nr:hypothetical protein [Luteipulveratus halotolerans]KNX37733.1 hypothetical protein VV01_12190 [Luteipulveratus halotolerans]